MTTISGTGQTPLTPIPTQTDVSGADAGNLTEGSPSAKLLEQIQSSEPHSFIENADRSFTFQRPDITNKTGIITFVDDNTIRLEYPSRRGVVFTVTTEKNLEGGYDVTVVLDNPGRAIDETVKLEVDTPPEFVEANPGSRTPQYELQIGGDTLF